MASNSAFRIAVFPGDGIGREIMPACLHVLDALTRRFPGVKLDYQPLEGGAAQYRDTGVDISDEAFAAAGAADAILFGAMGLPEVQLPDGTEVAPHLRMRTEFGLYAGMRPVRSFPNAAGPLADPRAAAIDLLILRESTEGLFASRGKGELIGDSEARDVMVITRDVCERLFDTAFREARRRAESRGRKASVTCVDKANVFVSMAFFRKIFLERARLFPDVEARCHYVDATALDLVRRPWDFDVMVMENMFGDIISDLGGGIVGGMGMAPCAEIGDRHGLFQPAHGSAPDIAGKDRANPTAMLLSAAMMLDWLGARHGVSDCIEAARALDSAIQQGFEERRVRPHEFGGDQGTRAIAGAIADILLEGVPA